MKGRPRKPINLHVIDGTYREHRHGGKIPSPGGSPKVPRHLGKDARKIWKEIARQLDGLGVLTLADSLVMERLCTAVVRRRAAELQLDAFKMSATANEEARLIMKQLFVFIRGESDEEMRLRGELGLGPASRSRLNVAPLPAHKGIATRDRNEEPPQVAGKIG